MVIRNIYIRILIRGSESKGMTNYARSNYLETDWECKSKIKQNKNVTNLRPIIILEGPLKKPPLEYQSQVRKAS